MSGSNSSAPGSHGSPEPLSFTVHSMPSPGFDADAARRTASGRLKMLLVLMVCAAPVIASYLAYFVIRPQGGATNYSTLITPTRGLPEALPLADLQGQKVPAASLKGQWLFVVVADAACDATCEKHLYLQRQLREALGRDKDRLDKVWLVTDAGTPRREVLQAIEQGGPATVLRVPREALAAWLSPAEGLALAQHIYIVDPMGEWMMRVPPNPDAAKLKRDLEKLLRASSSWDRPGRGTP